jgi:hypothetical protein
MVSDQGGDVTTYSYGQLEGLWISQGGSKALAPLMAAIALAESSGNDQAENPSGATGIWQILGAVNAADQGSLKNPQVNAREAVLKYKSQGLGAWVTYTDGSYKRFYQGNVPPGQLPQGGGSSNPVSGIPVIGPIVGGAISTADFFSHLDSAFGELWSGVVAIFNPSTYVRVAAGAAGVGLLMFGLFALAKAVS